MPRRPFLLLIWQPEATSRNVVPGDGRQAASDGERQGGERQAAGGRRQAAGGGRQDHRIVTLRVMSCDGVSLPPFSSKPTTPSEHPKENS